jgi:hypothetical protein
MKTFFMNHTPILQLPLGLHGLLALCLRVAIARISPVREVPLKEILPRQVPGLRSRCWRDVEIKEREKKKKKDE